MIKPILYERIEQKNEIERELFSKLTPQERSAVSKSWMRLLDSINKHRKSNEPGSRK
ncbi:MAG TPA: hypothetical protein VK517_01655 [Cyclobacteriaceae bacterium]|nr:hypothetical protein [Cyclobacteriaceae bacterium]